MAIATIYDIYDRFLSNPAISTDSRKIAQGSIFFALHGDNFDGNRFAEQALQTGAVLAVVDDPTVAVDDRYMLVEDTLASLQELAAHHRSMLEIPVLAITGSNGKTTTKELVARVLAQKFDIAVTQGNLNNHIGVPLTLLRITSSCQLAVVEMGASSCGEIALLCSIAKPDYGIITNVGRAHLEGFGGGDGVMRGKGELYDYLCANNGTAFYRSDDPILCDMIAARNSSAGKKGCMKAFPYTSEGSLPESQLVGDYNHYNIAAAVAIGKFFEIPSDRIAQAIWSYKPDNNRSQRIQTSKNNLIVDCYNANPSSMNAALQNFSRETGFTNSTENCCSDSSASSVAEGKWVILGDMLELGEYSTEEHTNVLRELEHCGISEAYVVGSNFCSAAQGYTAHSYILHPFVDRNTLQNGLEKSQPHGKFILIKGSRGIGLENVIEYL